MNYRSPFVPHCDRASDPDYSRIFVWRHSTQEFRQSEVAMQEVLDGLDPEDTRLRDAVLGLLKDSRPLL